MAGNGKGTTIEQVYDHGVAQHSSFDSKLILVVVGDFGNTWRCVRDGRHQHRVEAARLEEEPRDRWYRHFAADEKQPPLPALQFKGKLTDATSWIESTNEKPVFRAISQNQNVALVPLPRIIHERYSVYHEINENKG